MKNNDKKEKFISVAELAKILGISRIAVFNKIKKGQIEAIRIGRSYAINTGEVEDIISGSQKQIMTEEKKEEIKGAVEKIVKEYGETLKLLGKE